MYSFAKLTEQENTERIKELYGKIFNEHGGVNLCGREVCQELIYRLQELHPDVYFGDVEEGFMDTKNVKKYAWELISKSMDEKDDEADSSKIPNDLISRHDIINEIRAIQERSKPFAEFATAAYLKCLTAIASAPGFARKESYKIKEGVRPLVTGNHEKGEESYDAWKEDLTELEGEVLLMGFKCPSCGESVPHAKTGKVYAYCPYCGKKIGK